MLSLSCSILINRMVVGAPSIGPNAQCSALTSNPTQFESPLRQQLAIATALLTPTIITPRLPTDAFTPKSSTGSGMLFTR